MDIESNRTEYINEHGERVIATQGPGGVPVVGETVVGTPGAGPLIAGPEAEYIVHEPAVTETRRVSTFGSVALFAVVAGIVAVVLLVLGGITVARAGLDGAMDEPVVNVAGFTATALLGLIELGFGVVLLLAALGRAREFVLFLGVIGSVASIVAVFQPDIGNGALAMEKGLAVLLTILFLVVTVAAFLPTFRHSSSRIKRL